MGCQYLGCNGDRLEGEGLDDDVVGGSRSSQYANISFAKPEIKGAKDRKSKKKPMRQANRTDVALVTENKEDGYLMTT